MEEKRFNPKNLDKLNNPSRLQEFPVDFVVTQTTIKDPKVIVDIGAGTGFFSKQFALQFPDSMIHALDISDIMIDWMSDNLIPEYANIHPAKMDDNRTYLDDHISNLVIMVNLHHELDNPQQMLKESYRILKKNGFIAISDWRKREMTQGPPIHLRYEPYQIKTQMSAAGFRNIMIYNDFPNNFLIIGEK